MAERAFGRNTGDGAGALHHFLDHVENIFLARERHLDVNLRELRLAVGAQIFVAETFHDLEVAVHSRNHQNLFEDLRRLRQRVELPVMNAARDEIVARAFGRRTREHRRFDLEEAQLVHGLAHFEDHAVAQLEVCVRLRAAQVKVAIAQPSLFGSVHFFFNLEWRRLRVVQDVQARGHHFYFASGDFWI